MRLGSLTSLEYPETANSDPVGVFLAHNKDMKRDSGGELRTISPVGGFKVLNCLVHLFVSPSHSKLSIGNVF